MLLLEASLNPLWRPPLALAMLAATFKCAVTALLLEDPTLVTRSDFIRHRQDHSEGSARRRRVLLGLQLIFYAFATRFAAQDLAILLGSGSLSVFHRFHLLVFILAFSPNTVVAVAAVFTVGFRKYYLHKVPYIATGLCVVLDVMSDIFAVVMGLVYFVPLLLLSVVYGSLGVAAIGAVLLYDFCALPQRIFHMDFGSLWIAAEIGGLVLLWHALSAGVFLAQVLYFRSFYPELSAAIESSSSRRMIKQTMAPMATAARVIGVIRGSGGEAAVPGEDGEAHLMDSPDKEPAARLAVFGLESGGTESECCVISNEFVMIFAYVRAALCIAAPAVQLAVVVAAKIFIGEGFWQAPVTAFAERSWSHYWEHVHAAGGSAVVPLLWYFA